MTTSQNLQQSESLLKDERSNVFEEYLELFGNFGHRYKYFLAPNAVLDWFGSFEIRGPIKIHDFLLKKFSSRCHMNFDKAACKCSPIEINSSHMRTKHLPAYDVQLLNPKNFVTGITSLKTRAESEIEDEDTVMDTTPATLEPDQRVVPTTSNRVQNDDSNESEEYSARRCKRMKHNTPPSTPFKYLRRLPTKEPETDIFVSSDEDSSDDETEYMKQHKPQHIIASDYTQLRYLEAFGMLRKTKPSYLGDSFTEHPIRLRISYRKNLINQTTQFALIIYERRDQKLRNTFRSQRMLDFSKCNDDEDFTHAEDLDCIDAQPAIIMPNDDGINERDALTIATVETPSSAEIATALEEAAFTIQPPIQRTPKKATPIPPGTPKRRPRIPQICMSGVVPLATTLTKKLGTTNIPKRSAARNLRL